MKISKRIQKIQKELNLTQEEFAEKAGISTRVIRSWYYRGSNPRAEVLETILKSIPQINIRYLMLEEDPPILHGASAIYPEKKWSEEFVFLFENAKSPRLYHDLYSVVDENGLNEKLDNDLGAIVGSGFDLLSKALKRTPIEIFTEFYAKHLYAIVRDISARKPLDPIGIYLLCTIGRITPYEFRTFDQILCPPDEIEEFKRKIDKNSKWLLRLHNPENLSKKGINTVHAWKIIQDAYWQIAQSLRRDEFPNYCKIHERLYWSLDCSECSRKDCKGLKKTSN